MVRELQDVSDAVDEQLDAAAVQLFTGGDAVFNPAEGDEDDAESDSDSDGGGSSESDASDCASDDGASEWSSDGEGEKVPQADNRTRRRANFAGAMHVVGPEEVEANEEGGISSGGEEDEEDGNTARWRSKMLMKQSKLFSVRAGDVKRAVYGEKAVCSLPDTETGPEKDLATVRDITSAVEHSDESDDDELFQVKRPGVSEYGGWGATDAGGMHGGALDGPDSIYACLGAASDALSRWMDADEAVESLRCRVVTGGKAAFDDSRRRSIAEGERENEGAAGGADEAYGDFEDIETGEVFSGADAQTFSLCVTDDVCGPGWISRLSRLGDLQGARMLSRRLQSQLSKQRKRRRRESRYGIGSWP